jgi:malonyl-CoA/methylmalonyl-CoA synthetase
MPKNFLIDALEPRPSPHATFLTTLDGRAISYSELWAASGRFANALAALGVRPGDRVVMQVGKSPEAIFLYLACLRAGAVLVPLNTAYTIRELDYFIGDAGPSLVVCDPATRERIGELCAAREVPACETLDPAGGSLATLAASQSGAFADAERGPEDLAAILYTSGTTGRSKGAMLSQENLVSNALALVDTWRFTAADVLIHALPLFHTHGLFVATNCVLFAGASMVFLPKFDADAVFAALPKANVMMGVPTFYTRLLQDPRLTPETTAHVRLFVSGSAPLLAETHRQWQARTGHAILERYGMTETSMNTSNPYEGDRLPGTVGHALPGVELRIADAESGAPLGVDEIGMIEVRGPNVFKGYWGMPEKTAAEFRGDGFFITGDLGKFDERGYVHIVGRGKDLIITGGFNVYPKEVELELDSLPGVAESAVIGVSHPDFGEGVTAVVVPEAGAALDERTMLSALEGRLAKFKLPKRVIVVGELPRNAMGKVQKNVLRQEYAGLYAGSAAS